MQLAAFAGVDLTAAFGTVDNSILITRMAQKVGLQVLLWF